MIELREVTKEYSKGVAALNGINLKIEQGEFVFIVGDSGSGKSTLIKLIMKELEPTSGTIIVNGNNLSRMKHRRVPMYRRNIGVVFQDFRLLKDRNIYENIAFAQRVTETSTRIIKKKVPAALSLVGLAQKYKAFPKELSGGEQQRVAIEAMENILFLRMFLTPCFIEYPIVLILMLVPTFFLVAYNDTFFHCNNPLLHFVHDFLVMRNDQNRSSSVICLFQQFHNLP